MDQSGSNRAALSTHPSDAEGFAEAVEKLTAHYPMRPCWSAGDLRHVVAEAMDKPLGTATFHLLDAMAYAPDDHKGQTVYIRGLLIKLAGESRITISTFERVSPACRE